MQALYGYVQLGVRPLAHSIAATAFQENVVHEVLSTSCTGTLSPSMITLRKGYRAITRNSDTYPPPLNLVRGYTFLTWLLQEGLDSSDLSLQAGLEAEFDAHTVLLRSVPGRKVLPRELRLWLFPD